MRIEEIRRDLTSRLRARQTEIEQAILDRIQAVSDSDEKVDPEYAHGLRAAVSAALEYGIEAVERSEDRPPAMPMVLLFQARLAARHHVKLETVLRRYLAGYTLLGDFMIEESERGGPLEGAALKRLLRVLAALLDRLIAAVSEEYEREATARPGSEEQRLAERVEQLLAGQHLDTSGIPYNFETVHQGLIAVGPGAAEALREMVDSLDRRQLHVCREQGTAWAWLGGRHALDPEALDRIASECLPANVSLALGEPGEGLKGWRLTHRQARAALPIATRGREPLVRYADVALLASNLQDDLLVTSLQEIYLAPLEAERDKGEVARRTLAAYFACERNAASAAASLKVTRQTVNNRLHVIEERIGRPLNSCASDLEALLRLDELGEVPTALSTLAPPD